MYFFLENACPLKLPLHIPISIIIEDVGKKDRFERKMCVLQKFHRFTVFNEKALGAHNSKDKKTNNIPN